MSSRLRIVFMGTPEFAVPAVDALVKDGFDVAAIVTVPDKPAGRGQQLQESAVKKYALSQHIPVLQPEKLKAPEFVDQLQQIAADLFVVVAFRMLPEVVWNMPRLGTINLHGSLLPKYRGAAPINRAVMNGEHETGVTTFFLQHEIDTGRVIMREKMSIGENETAGEVHDRMMLMGAQTLLKTVQKIEAGTADAIPQEELVQSGESIIHAPKIFKEDCRIHWNQSVDAIHNFVRGLSPYPAAFTDLQGKTFKIYAGIKKKTAHSEEAGSWKIIDQKELLFAATDGYYSVTEVQLEGKKKMKTEEFLRGFKG